LGATTAGDREDRLARAGDIAAARDFAYPL